MKKKGFGTRPSEMKGRTKKIDFDEGAMQSARTHHTQSDETVLNARRKPPRRSGTALKMIAGAVFLLVAGILVGSLFSSGFSLQPALDHVVFVSGERKVGVQEGAPFTVPFRDGLVLQRVNLKGLYRFFPPDDIVVSVSGVPEETNLFGVDIVPLLAPEKELSYTMDIRKGADVLGKISIVLTMNAQDWISRAEMVEDKKVQTVCYNKAIALDPDSEESHVALGRLYEKEKKITKAIAEYRHAIRINPANVSALQSLAKLYKRKGSSKRLQQTYEKLGKADEKKADIHYFQAGRIAEKRRLPDKAMVLYRKALSKNRAHIDARQRLIKLYEKGKQWNRVAGNTRVLLEYTPKNADLYIYLSEAYLQMDKVSAALRAAKKAEGLKPRDESIYIQLALLHERAKKNNDALAYYKKALKINDKNAAVCNNIGVLLEQKGRRSEAVGYYEKAVALEGGNTGYCINLADAYEKLKKWKKASALYEKIVARDKTNKAAWESLAVVQYKAKNKWKALEAYQALSRLEPKKILWHKKTAVLYEQLGRLDKARQQYKIILGIDPSNKEAKQKYVEISKKQVKGRVK